MVDSFHWRSKAATTAAWLNCRLRPRFPTQDSELTLDTEASSTSRHEVRGTLVIKNRGPAATEGIAIDWPCDARAFHVPEE